jgi:Ras-related protein Rab-1A
MESKSKPHYLFKFVIEGNPCSGKTSLHFRMIDNTYAESLPCTIGLEFRIKTIELGSTVFKVQLWDTAGGERFRNAPPAYYRGAQGIFVVYDVTNRASFMDVPRLLSVIRLHAPQDAAMLMLGNKSDLETQREVSFEEGKALADELRVSFMETSAKTSANVAAAFVSMVALRRIESAL